MTCKNLCLDSSRSERLTELQIDCGTADGYWHWGDDLEGHLTYWFSTSKKIQPSVWKYRNLVKTYRYDKLRLKLPEHKTKQRYVEELDSYLIYRTYNGEYIPYIDSLISAMLFDRGQVQLNAIADILIRLKETELKENINV